MKSTLGFICVGAVAFMLGSPNAYADRKVTVCVEENGVKRCVTEEGPGEDQGFRATARCSATGAIGISAPSETSDDAIEEAVANCIDNGGVPDCCRRGARITD